MLELQDDAQDVVRQVDHTVWRRHVPDVRANLRAAVVVRIVGRVALRREVQDHTQDVGQPLIRKMITASAAVATP